MDGTRGTGSSTGRRRLVLVACVFVVLPALVGGLVLWYQVSAHGTAAPGHRIVPGADMAARLLMAAAVVLGASHAAGRLAVLLGQPPVIGEICAGILLGPSLLGRAAPQLWARLFPEGILPMLDGLAQLGLVFFMFKVGRDLSSVRLRALGGRTLLVSLASLAVPFAGGAVAAVALADGHAGPAGPVAFTVFLGCALGITAFPVLARILSELGLSHTAVGRTSLLAAAIGDAGAWLLLATAVAAAGAAGSSGPGIALMVAGTAVAAVLLGPLRRALRRALSRRYGNNGEEGAAGLPVPLLACAVCGCAAFTSAVGLHAAIGAFLAGAVLPAGSGPVSSAADRLGSFSAGILMPFFFLGFGLSVDLSALSPDSGTVVTGSVLLALAVLTKLLGPGLCAWVTGMSRGDALKLGVLLNARGLTELVVLGIGLQAGLIDRQLFTVLTAVTLTTTILPAPVLRLMDRRAKRAPSGASPPGAPARGAPEEQAPQPSGGPLAPEER
ncbi:cation:proton antiporter [Streptomyces diastaticus]